MTEQEPEGPTDETMPMTHSSWGEPPRDNPYTSPGGPSQQPSGASYVTPGSYVPPAGAGQPPQPYGSYGGYAGYVPPAEHPQASTAMVLGIVAIVGTFVCGVLAVLGPFAWWMGAKVRREIDAEPGRWGGRGSATTGMVLGIVTTVLLVLALLAVVVVLAIIATSASV